MKEYLLTLLLVLALSLNAMALGIVLSKHLRQQNTPTPCQTDMECELQCGGPV